MSVLRSFALIVEGDGDQGAVPIIVRDRLHKRGVYDVNVRKPFNAKGRGNLLRDGQLERWLQLAALDDDTCGVLVVCDAETDAPCELGPVLTKRCQQTLPTLPVRVSLAVRQFENWIVASSEAIRAETLEDVDDYEGAGGIATIRAWRRPRSYVKPLHQPGYAAQLDHAVVAERCPSFARLLRCIDELAAACVA